MRLALFGLVLAGLLSCKKESAIENSANQDSLSTKTVSENKPLNPNFETILEKFPLKSIPVVDSTNFDNENLLKPLAEADLKELKLDKVFADGSNFKINSRYELSPDFKTISVSFNKGEMEISTELLNFNLQGELIDHMEVAYDEIAESAFRKSSQISKDKIVLTDENYLEDLAKIQKFTYKILPSGKIQK